VEIDASKACLDVHVRSEATALRAPNSSARIRKPVALVTRLASKRVVADATGGLERPVADALGVAGAPVVVVAPDRVRHFARALGVLAKTDRIDAAVLARYGALVQPEPRPAPDAASRALGHLAARRRQLTMMLAAEKNRLQSLARELRADVRLHIRWLELRRPGRHPAFD